MKHDSAVKKLAFARQGVILLIIMVVPLILLLSMASDIARIFSACAFFLALIFFMALHDRYARELRFSEPVWYYRNEEKNVGPISLDDIQPLIANGIVNNDTMIWKVGSSKWNNARKALPSFFKSIPPSPPKALNRPEQCRGNIEVPDACSHPKSGLAIASLICGIVGGVFSTASIPAVICGHVALYKINRDPSSNGGRKMAIAGLILGYIGIILAIVLGTMRGILWSQLMSLQKMGY